MATPPPTGPVSAEYIGWQIGVFTAVFVPVQIIAVALRYYSRFIVDSSWGLDDALVGLGLACQLIQAGIGIGAVKQGGMGYHTDYLMVTDPTRLYAWGKYLTAISIFYFATLNIPKLAILALFHRLFPGKTPRRIICVIAAILITQTISVTATALAACRPFEANWNPALVAEGKAYCIDKESLFIWTSLPSIATDLAMQVFPLPILWNLHTNKRMKVGLTFTFLVGSLGIITSVLRFTGFFRNNSFTDGTFAAVELMMWTEVEPGVYLICACLPCYRPLLEKIGVGRLVASATSRRGTNPEKSLTRGPSRSQRSRTLSWTGPCPASERQAIKFNPASPAYDIYPGTFYKKHSISSASDGSTELDANEQIKVTTSIRVAPHGERGDNGGRHV